jgi:hypothetical protein
MIQKTEHGWTGSITDLPFWGREPEMGLPAVLVTVMENETEVLAGKLYTVYCVAVGGKAHDGKPLPAWPEFRADPSKNLQSDAWVAVACVCRAEHLS